jgi:hypothetical protein
LEADIWMKTEVLSFVTDTDAIRQAKAEGRFVYIGRLHWHRPAGQRNWGNYAPDGRPNKDKPDQFAEHKRAVEAFRKWVITQPNLMTHVAELRGKALVCHCKGLPCHGEVLKKLADKKAKRGRPVSEHGAFQREQAKQLQVSLRTVQRWEKTRQEIKADPELAALATSVEGNQAAKRLLRQRKKVEEAPYNAVKSLFSAIKAWEALGEEDAELVRDYLLETDFLDRLTTLLERDN